MMFDWSVAHLQQAMIGMAWSTYSTINNSIWADIFSLAKALSPSEKPDYLGKELIAIVLKEFEVRMGEEIITALSDFLVPIMW